MKGINPEVMAGRILYFAIIYREKIMDSGRRLFFRKFLLDVFVGVEELRGRQYIKLGDLVQAPDSVLKKVIPVLRKDGSYRIEDRLISKKDRKTGAFLEVYQMTPQEKCFFQYFDGKHTLEEIGRIGESELGLECEDSYYSVKTLFCTLATQLVCQPLHPLIDNNDDS